MFILSFAEGLKALGVLSALREHPKQMTALFIKKDQPLTTEFMEELVKMTLSEAGSNRYNIEYRTVGYWRDVLQDCQCKYFMYVYFYTDLH